MLFSLPSKLFWVKIHFKLNLKFSRLLYSFRFENKVCSLPENRQFFSNPNGCSEHQILSVNSTWDIYLWLYYNLVLFVKGVIAPFSHGFREQIAINVGGRSGCHQMIFIWSWEKNLGSLSHWLRSLVSISPLLYDDSRAAPLVPSSHFSQQHTVVHSLDMPNEVKDRLLEWVINRTFFLNSCTRYWFIK